MSVSAVCSRLIADTVATEFTWLGRSKKQCFNKLTAANILQKTFKMIGKETWSTKEIYDAIVKWFTQAKTRISRAKNSPQNSSDKEEAVIEL
ncbi:hypothetical protein PV325_007932 [Microctonus aethiopoides]|uniref:DUF4806 domain-containing protein n=1 Tax=Microctonus aethiopoides TaxID=144406 RepID=A0AA39FXQ2_9HYME|nr:hypothetical protein PV325_007932 [Microctonus aethiopoides]KAK0177154.1 hypothetical protein PV328_001233 [Microctonus aethiopoides]